MIRALLLLTLLTARVSQYAPGKLEAVARVRQQPGRTAHTLPTPLPQTDGLIAALDCDAIGEVWTLRYCNPAGRCFVETFLVADCSGDDATTRWMQRGNIVGEVDGATADRWGIVGRGAWVDVVITTAMMPE